MHQNWIDSEDMQKEDSGDDKESGGDEDSPVKKKRKNRRKNKRRKKKEAQEGAVQGDANLLGGTEANRMMEGGSSMYHGVNGDCAQEDGGTVIGNTSEADFEKYL